MYETGVATIFDVTHSLQLPAAGGAAGEVSSGLREFAPVLARAAVATGYVSGLFVETHTNPNQAKSDAATQLSIEQTETSLEATYPNAKSSRQLQEKDGSLLRNLCLYSSTDTIFVHRLGDPKWKIGALHSRCEVCDGPTKLQGR